MTVWTINRSMEISESLLSQKHNPYKSDTTSTQHPPCLLLLGDIPLGDSLTDIRHTKVSVNQNNFPPLIQTCFNTHPYDVLNIIIVDINHRILLVTTISF